MEINILGTIEPTTIGGVSTDLWIELGDDYYKDRVLYSHELDYHKRSVVSPPDDLREWISVLR